MLFAGRGLAVVLLLDRRQLRSPASGRPRATRLAWPESTLPRESPTKLAKINAPWDRDRIYGLKGILDFYTWKGIPTVRSWPQTTRSSLTPATKAQWPVFGYITQQWPYTDVSVAEALREMSIETQRVPRDYQLELYYNRGVTLDDA